MTAAVWFTTGVAVGQLTLLFVLALFHAGKDDR